MSTEENKAIVRRFYEEVNKQNFAVFDEVTAEDCSYHGLPPEMAPTRETIRQPFVETFAAFPDWQFILNDLVAEGDKVVQYLTETGTQTGEFMGIPPCGKRVTSDAMVMARLAGGKVVEVWTVADNLGFYQQVDALPALGQAPS